MIFRSSSEISSAERRLPGPPACCMASTLSGSDLYLGTLPASTIERSGGLLSSPLLSSRPRTATTLPEFSVPIEQLLLLLGMAIAVIVTLIGVVVAAWFQWKHGADEGASVPAPFISEPTGGLSILGPRTAADVAALNIPRPGTADRAIRVMAFLFLAAVAVFVAVTDAFPANTVAIELLLAAGILFVVFMQDLLPTSALGRARYWIEAAAAIIFMAVLTGLSGGLSSPFLPGFFLIVAGASLAIDGLAPMLLAVLAGLRYGLVGVLVAGPGAIMPTTLAWLGFNVVALVLLAYLATVAGREQRYARDAAIRLSRFDPLTGLYNRSFFFSVMDREIRRAVRIGRGFSLLMLDLDDLKPVNDTFGHQYGDRLLRAVTDVVQRSVRGTDIAARYGGDEFVVMLPDTDPSRCLRGCRKAANRRREPGTPRGRAQRSHVGVDRARGVRGGRHHDRDADGLRGRGDVRGQAARQEPDRGLRDAHRAGCVRPSDLP